MAETKMDTTLAAVMSAGTGVYGMIIYNTNASFSGGMQSGGAEARPVEPA